MYNVLLFKSRHHLCKGPMREKIQTLNCLHCLADFRGFYNLCAGYYNSVCPRHETISSHLKAQPILRTPVYNSTENGGFPTIIVNIYCQRTISATVSSYLVSSSN